MRSTEAPHVSEELVEWLEKHYSPRSIGKDEAPEDARWHAAKVELAQTLIRFGKRQEDDRDANTQSYEGD